MHFILATVKTKISLITTKQVLLIEYILWFSVFQVYATPKYIFYQ